MTERHRATRTQQQERLEDWSETVQKELDAVESAHEAYKSAFEKALLSVSEAATRLSADRIRKLRRIAELDDEFGLLQRDNGALARRLNAVSTISTSRHCKLRSYARLKLRTPKSGTTSGHFVGTAKRRRSPQAVKKSGGCATIPWRASNRIFRRHTTRVGMSF